MVKRIFPDLHRQSEDSVESHGWSLYAERCYPWDDNIGRGAEWCTDYDDFWLDWDDQLIGCKHAVRIWGDSCAVNIPANVKHV